jgi:Tfp pilus assembly protein PilF
MGTRLDDLLARWRADPRASTTIALCQALAEGCSQPGGAPEDQALAVGVGRAAAARYPEDASVLLAVGRMYLAAGELSEARTIVVKAARLVPDDGRAFRLLGEMQLRRGDARRAEKAFDRAVALGIGDSDTLEWLERAHASVDLQEKRGNEAVAEEVARILAGQAAARLPAGKPASSAPPPEEAPVALGAPGAARNPPATLRGPIAEPGAPAPPPRTLRGPVGAAPSPQVAPPIPPVTLRGPVGAVPSPPGAPKAPLGKATTIPILPNEGGAAANAPGKIRGLAGPPGRTRPLPPRSPTLIGMEAPPLARPAAPEPQRTRTIPGVATAGWTPAARPAGEALITARELNDLVDSQEDSDLTRVRVESMPPTDDSTVTRTAPLPTASPPSHSDTELLPAPADPMASTTIMSPPEGAPGEDWTATRQFPEPGNAMASTLVLPPQAGAPIAPGGAPPGIPKPSGGAIGPPPPPPVPRRSGGAIGPPPPPPPIPRRSGGAIGPPPPPPVPRPKANAMGAPPVPAHARHDTLADDPSTDVTSLDTLLEPRADRRSHAGGSNRTTEVLPEDVDSRPTPPEAAPAISPNARLGAPESDSGLIPVDFDESAPRHLPSLMGDTGSLSAPLQHDSRIAARGTEGPPMSASELIDEFGEPDARAPLFRPAPHPPPGLVLPPQAGEQPKKPRRSRAGRIIAFFVGMIVMGGLGGGGYFEWERRRVEDAQAARDLVAKAETAVLRGGRALDDAEQSLLRARELDPTAREAALMTARVAALRLLDGSAGDAQDRALAEAMSQAKALGASEGELAFAAITAAAAAKDPKRVDGLLESHDKDTACRADAHYELAAGAALDMRGDARAVQRYEAAVRLESRLVSAQVRLVRAALLHGDVKDGAKRARALAEKFPGRAEGPVLVAFAGALDPDSAGKPAAIDPATVVDLPRPLRSIAWALSYDPARAATGLAAAIDDADTPTVAIYCGRRALAAGDAASARQAAERALALAPAYRSALSMMAELHLRDGRLPEALAAAEALDPRGAAEVRAIVAYESGDPVKLAAAVKTFDDPKAAPAQVAIAARDRLLGARPLDRDRLKFLRQSKQLWSDIVAADVALDEGDLTRAHEIIDPWSGGAKHPILALRVGRLQRYEGKLPEARAALQAASPTRPARIERALLDAETKEERAKAIAALDESMEPERKWIQAYLKARSGGLAAAQKIMAPLRIPDPDAPFSLRVAAALALGEIADSFRGGGTTRALLAGWPKNPDIIRAAVGLRLLPTSALTTRR